MPAPERSAGAADCQGIFEMNRPESALEMDEEFRVTHRRDRRPSSLAVTGGKTMQRLDLLDPSKDAFSERWPLFSPAMRVKRLEVPGSILAFLD